MAKKAKKRVSRELTRKQRSRLEQEKRIERWLIWGVTVVASAVVLVLGFGFYIEEIKKPREPVAIVSGTPITTAKFQARVRFMRMQMNYELQYLFLQQLELDPTDPDNEYYLQYLQGQIRDLQTQLLPANALAIGEQVLNQLLVEELVRQEAERRGIEVTTTEVDREIELYFGYDPNPATPTPAPTATPPLTPTDVLTPTPTSTPLPTPIPMTKEEFEQQKGAFLKTLDELDISEQQFRSQFEASLLTDNLREEMQAEIPTTADQVNLRTLTVDSEERANELAARLDAGEDFQTLADELEEDEQVTGYALELGWYPKSMLEQSFGTELVNKVFSLEVGGHTQPRLLSEGSTSYTIIEVVGHEVRELESYVLNQLAEDAFQEWLEAQQILVERMEYDPDIVPTEPPEL